MPTLFRPLRAAITALLVTVLGACATGQITREPAPAAVRSPDTLLAEADAALETRDYVAAAHAYRLAAEASEDEAVAEQATRAAFERFQFEESALATQRWLELNPSSEQAQRYAGVTALKLHRLDTAEQHFATLLESAYLSPAAGFLALLPVISGEGTPADVTELLRRLADRQPKVAEGHYAVGSAALRSDNFALASARAALAVELAPYWVPAKMLQGRVQVAVGAEEAGLASIKALAQAPDADLATRLEYAYLLFGTGRNAEARTVLTPYARGQTVVPGAIRALGLLELQEGNLDAATQRFEELLATGTANDDANYYLAGIAERREDRERALRLYGRVGGDLEYPSQQRIARLKADSEGLEAGLAQLSLRGDADARLGPAYYTNRASLASALGDEARALVELEHGLELYPRSSELRLARAYLYERTDELERALREMRALLAERPGDAVLQNALGYTLADRTRQYEEAHSLVAAALAQTPDSVAVLDSMGWVLHRLGRDTEALAYLEKARARGEDSEIEYHVGEVQWAIGDRAAAQATWTEALKRDPEDVRLKERLERIRP